MRSVWKGAITFGLVNIPVALYPATSRNDLSFRLLHAKDASPIAYRRVCTAENVEVPWPEIGSMDPSSGPDWSPSSSGERAKENQ